VYDGQVEGVGGTSLASPVFIAMQAAINSVQGSRNGFVNPRLYAIAAAEYTANGTTGTTGPAGLPGNYSFALRDITSGNDGTYDAGNGYDLASGLGSLLGWELAGTE
jgi:subtilase family serine protease